MRILLLSLGILFASELEVQGDLKVTGNIQNDSLQQVIELQQQHIIELQQQMLVMQNLLNYLLDNFDIPIDCNDDIGGTAEFDECGVCGGIGIPSGDCDCFGNTFDVCGVCGGEEDNIMYCGYMTDIDGNIYDTIVIGNQLWMKENLRTTRYSNGDSIIDATSFDFYYSEWLESEEGMYTYYNNDPNTYEIYGPLYNGYAIDDSRGICPSGWHVPTDDEWMILELELGMNPNELYNDGNTAWRGAEAQVGYQMKDELVWNGSNSSGFSAFQSGFVEHPTLDFEHFGNEAYFWSSTYNSSAGYYYNRGLGSSQSGIKRNSYNPAFGCSVRCVAN